MANLLVTLWIVRVLPQTVVRSLFQWYFRVFSPSQSRGAGEFGLAAWERSILVINHLSFLDGCLVAAFVPGDLVFAIDTNQFRAILVLEVCA